MRRFYESMGEPTSSKPRRAPSQTKVSLSLITMPTQGFHIYMRPLSGAADPYHCPGRCYQRRALQGIQGH